MENLWKTFQTFGLLLDQNQQEQVRIHFELLNKWKEVHNLTTIDSPEKIFLYHYVDSFLGLKILEKIATGNEIYDLGSGAGFPGLMAAILWPEKRIFLVESSRKKCSFLKLSSSAMRLNRTNILEQRVDQLKNIPFAITRATFSPENWGILEQAIIPGGKIAFWLSEKSPLPTKLGWVLERQVQYELEPGHKRQIAVFHVEREVRKEI